MLNSLQKEINRYCREVRSLLITQTKESKRFLMEFRASVNDYIEANNVRSFSEVRAHFGEPEEIAKAFLDTTQLVYIRKRLRIKNAVLFILLAALLIWFGYATAAFLHELKVPYFSVDEIIEGTVPEESFTIDERV